MTEERDILVVGGGFFGCSLASFLAQSGKKVLLCEREEHFLSRASYCNQARVHNGYHYPRSILTALRSRINFPQFIKDYPECIDSSFAHYYAVPRKFSKVSARQFSLFMERIKAPIRPAPAEIRRLFNRDLIEDVFLVTEYAFDAVKLKNLVEARMQKAGVEIWRQAEVNRLELENNDRIRAHIDHQGNRRELVIGQVLNCTYSNINHLLTNSRVPRIKLKQEITEMALVEPPDIFRDKAVTVMCGPFFSAMPFPPKGLHTLSHVRYTPHCSWVEGPDTEYQSAYEIFSRYPQQSSFEHMRHDAVRYLPCLGQSRQVGSLWEVKTVLPQSEVDDSRPILFKRIETMPGLFCIMGGKIDNIYDAYEELQKMA